MAEMLTDKQIQALFVEKAEAKHAAAVPAYGKLKALVEEKGGIFAGDHIALRTTDERVAKLIKKVGAVMNLHRPEGEKEYPYKFPDKRLKSFDLLDKNGDDRELKLFVSVWDRATMEDKQAALAIDEDLDVKYQSSVRYYNEISALADKAAKQGGLSRADAENLTDLTVDRLLTRNGPPLEQATYALVAKESGELASAMVLGEGINHFTVDVRRSGFGSTEEMRLAAAAAGMKVLDKTQGREGWLLQSATMAEPEPITLRGKDGRDTQAAAPLRFMEFISRPELPGGEKHRDGAPKRYARFEQTNAQAIFKAASVSTPD